MSRFTVNVSNRYNVGVPHCVICGTRRTIGNGVCANMCHWILPGWVGYNAITEKYKIFAHEALGLSPMWKWNPATRRVTPPSFPRLVAKARVLGWRGSTNAPSQPCFVPW